jgi:enoyl-CoA hydratase/carnithine racemase
MLDIKITDHVAQVTLARPEKKNAINFDMMDALTAGAQQIADEPSVRAVVMSGAGDCFCAGIDLELLQNVASRMDDTKRQMRVDVQDGLGNLFQRPFLAWRALNVPVIAAIEGVCYGAGMQLALAADFRIAGHDARLSIMEAKWGLIPDMGITSMLPGLMRADQAKALFMTGRVLDPAQAQNLGLITEQAQDPHAAALAMAQDLAGRSPEAVQSSKRLVDAAWATDRSLLALEAELQANLMGSPNQMETVMAQMQRRRPVFK